MGKILTTISTTYQCTSCHKLFQDYQLVEKKTSLYGKDITEKVCPYCSSKIILMKDHRFTP